eukprot:107835_1
MSTEEFVRRGVEKIKEAVQKDGEEDYLSALILYRQGIQYLMAALKHEKNGKVRAALKGKIEVYMTRAEELKEITTPSKKKSQRTTRLISSDNGLKKPNYASTYIVYGFFRRNEKISNHFLHYALPDGIISLCLQYYYIEKTYVPNPRHYKITHATNITWDDVCGMQDVKDDLLETLIRPLLYSHLKSLNSGNILLFGPPGVGKSLLTKALFTALDQITCLRIYASELIHRHGSNSNKLIRNIFQMARDERPSILVFDDVDGSMHKRLSGITLLEEMTCVTQCTNVYCIVITSTPWDLDDAFCRTFTKKLFIGLPNRDARKCIMKQHIGTTPSVLSDEDLEQIAGATEGFSGSDISCLVRDAMMEPIRAIQCATHFKRIDRNDGTQYALAPCKRDEQGTMEMGYLDMSNEDAARIHVEPLSAAHFENVLQTAKPSLSEDDVKKHTDWQQSHVFIDPMKQ